MRLRFAKTKRVSFGFYLGRKHDRVAGGVRLLACIRSDSRSSPSPPSPSLCAPALAQPRGVYSWLLPNLFAPQYLAQYLGASLRAFLFATHSNSLPVSKHTLSPHLHPLLLYHLILAPVNSFTPQYIGVFPLERGLRGMSTRLSSKILGRLDLKSTPRSRPALLVCFHNYILCTQTAPRRDQSGTACGGVSPVRFAPQLYKILNYTKF